MSVEFQGYWSDTNSLQMQRRSPDQFARILQEISVKTLEKEPPDEVIKRLQKIFADINDCVLVDEQKV